MVCDMLELQLGVEQAKAVIDALVSLVTGCAIALSWRITEDDLRKMESSFVNWNQYMYNHVPMNMYSSNMHYLRYIPEMVKLLGPLRGFSARSMEWAIGFLKKCIKSQKNPGVNAVEDYADVNLRHYLVKFWKRKFPNDRIGRNDIADSIIVGRRLYMDRGVYDAIKAKRKMDKLCHFVKMDIEVDQKKASRNTPKDLQVQTFFGEVIMYFAHEYKGKKYILCLVDILNGVELNGAGCPYGPYGIDHTGGRRYVVEVEAITCHAGILSMPMTTTLITDSTTYRNYYIYPKMVPRAIVAGDVGLL
ncbi:hypothetical protein BDA99DRAFT_565248 [Phascolomyces articulosus]|uniref:Uncharacterized protein n=1 Tax=Phascolomyces articulosus TaxID=60185 RepID=A0AAD5JNE6_9FUNG|nr:hypothetical protein BDA99DRAFT_565248 [Phascolomyces articulosus]